MFNPHHNAGRIMTPILQILGLRGANRLAHTVSVALGRQGLDSSWPSPPSPQPERLLLVLTGAISAAAVTTLLGRQCDVIRIMSS